MSKKNSRKQVEKKRARQKAVKKVLIEKRLADRKAKRLEFERELAYEREFNDKQKKLGLTQDEVRERLENNMKVLEALEEQMEKEEAARGESDAGNKSRAQLDLIEEFGVLQKDLIELHQLKKELEGKGEFTDEAKEKFTTQVEEIHKKLQDLDDAQKKLAIPT